MGFWNTIKERAKDPFDGLGLPGDALNWVYKQLPVDNLVRMGEEAAKGNWAGAAGNLGIAGLDTLSLLTLGSGSAAKTGVGSIIKGLGAAEDASKVAKTAGVLARTAFTPVGKKQLVGNLLIGGLAPGVVRGAKAATKPAMAAAASVPATPGSAANFRMADQASMSKYRAGLPDAGERMVAYKKQQAAAAPDALERMLAYKKSRGELGPKPDKPEAPGNPFSGLGKPAAPKPVGPAELAALTPDQMEEAALQGRSIQEQYDRLVNEFAKQESAGRLAAEQETRLAQNIQAGDTQNLATNLANIGMDLSPGPAMIGEQNIAEVSQGRQDVAARNLTDLLAQLESGKTQATSGRERSVADLQKVITRQRLMNTLADLQNAYGQFQ